MIPLWKPVSEEFDWLSQGQATEELEKKLAAFVGARYAVAVSSGTSAIYLALKACGINDTHSVAVPDLTAIATINAVRMTGAKPVIYDINCDNAIMLPEDCDCDLAIPVHFNGRDACCDFDKVIEDSCQAFGSMYDGSSMRIGAKGLCGCFSFSPTKTIYAGQGGVVVTNHRWLYEEVYMLRDQGRRDKSEMYFRESLNFKFTDLQAKVALKHYDMVNLILQRKREVYEQYFEELGEWMISPKETEVIWLPDIYSAKRDIIEMHLQKKSVSCRRFYPPLHIQTPYLMRTDFPNAERVSETGLWLPSNPSDEEISYICKAVKEVLR